MIEGTFIGSLHLPILDARQPVDIMKKILLATVTVLAFAAPSFAAETGKTVGQAPPSGASTFYLAQDTASMKCQAACRRWQHEGYRGGSSDPVIRANSFDG